MYMSLCMYMLCSLSLFSIGVLMPGVLERHNKLNGRQKASRVDLDVYCPPDVLQVGGPLFGDAESMQEAFDSFISAKCVNDKLHMHKCSICGFPDCPCPACISIINSITHDSKTHAKSFHTCLLQHVDKPKGGAPPKHGHYDAEQQSQLDIAWQAKGIPGAPVFRKVKNGRSGYYWPEEA